MAEAARDQSADSRPISFDNIVLQYAGQGQDPLSELKSLSGRPSLSPWFTLAATILDAELKTDTATSILKEIGLNLETFELAKLLAKDADPTTEKFFACHAPLSFPLNALISWLNLLLLAQDLDFELSQLLKKTATSIGHSQGIVVAAFASTVTRQEDVQPAFSACLRYTFYLGLRLQQAAAVGGTAQTLFYNDNDEGMDLSPMLVVLALTREEVELAIAEVARAADTTSADSLPKISLVNAKGALVVSCPDLALIELLRSQIQKIQREKLRTFYLPVTAGFHHPLLQPAAAMLAQDCARASIGLTPEQLAHPVLSTADGSDLRSHTGDIVTHMAELVASVEVNWPVVTCAAASHDAVVLDVGPGASIAWLTAVNCKTSCPSATVIAASWLAAETNSVKDDSHTPFPRTALNKFVKNEEKK